jgi:hypothetical protein
MIAGFVINCHLNDAIPEIFYEDWGVEREPTRMKRVQEAAY